MNPGEENCLIHLILDIVYELEISITVQVYLRLLII